jgi:hypothetical protein
MVIQKVMTAKKIHYVLTLFLLFSSIGTWCHAAGVAIDKVYLPYVQPLEKELEYRMLSSNSGGEQSSQHKLGYGASVTESWFAEVYLIGEKTDEEFILSDYEVEAKLQLTEQGEFYIDWGLLFELEKSANGLDVWEASTGILAVKSFRKISVVANAFLVQEWGRDIENEFEQKGALKMRYRLQPEFEPGIELYAGNGGAAIGPVIMGRIKVASQQKLFWQLGMLFDNDNQGSQRVFQLQLEYEFL